MNNRKMPSDAQLRKFARVEAQYQRARTQPVSEDQAHTVEEFQATLDTVQDFQPRDLGEFTAEEARAAGL